MDYIAQRRESRGMSGYHSPEGHHAFSRIIFEWASEMSGYCPALLRNEAWAAAMLEAQAAKPDHEKERSRLEILREWVLSSVLPSIATIPGDLGGPPEQRAAWSAQSEARRAFGPEIREGYGQPGSGIHSGDRARNASRCAWYAVQARADRVAPDARAEEIRQTWKLFDPPGLLRRLIAA